MKKREIIANLGLFLILALLLIFLNLKNANSNPDISFCCEKTTSGAWCIDAPENQCNPSFRSVPTSCQATSYCQLGTCVNSQEGNCQSNVPQKVCQDNGGVWDPRLKEEITSCQVGCCVTGDQASLTTLTRCKRLSAVYGLETDYRTNIVSELECLAQAQPDTKGACVLDTGSEKTCRILTRAECAASSDASFHEGYLCSAEELGTSCGPSRTTTCVEGSDDVYYLDTCGNLANVYDSSKYNNQDYWTRIQEPTCGDGKGSRSCGDCDYYSGSVCKQAPRGQTPTYGDYVCRSLDCEYDVNRNGRIDSNEKFNHGERWCMSNTKSGLTDITLPGSTDAVVSCFNNEITFETCSQYRQEVCVSSSVEDFSTAACRANLWRDCFGIKDQEECENIDFRDCKWVDHPLTSSGSEDDYVCIPKYTLGFNTNSTDSIENGVDICSLSSTDITVVFEESRIGSAIGSKWNCKQNCDFCANDGSHEDCRGSIVNGVPSWGTALNNFCMSLGDCGDKLNFMGYTGDSGNSILSDPSIDGFRTRLWNRGD